MELIVENLTFAYSNRNILEHCSLSYATPDVMCILGHNGTGKSTLLQCLIGAFKPQEGSVRIDGRSVEDYTPRELAAKIAYIPQTSVPTFSFPCIDVVTMGRTAHMGYLANPGAEEVEKAYEALEYLNITYLADQPYTDISGGERQLVMIASALCQDPELMILDEPTAHLDFGNQYKFIQLVERLRDRGMGVLMTTHFPDHALALDGTTAILSHGSVQAIGAARDIITDESMSALYNIPVAVCDVGDRRICIAGGLHDGLT